MIYRILVLSLLAFSALAEHQTDLNDFEARSQNIKALFSAFRSSAISANIPSRIPPLETKITRDINQARTLYQQHQSKAGQDLLKQSYDTVKLAIIQLRDGSTVTNTRNGDQYTTGNSEPAGERDYNKLNNSIDALLQAYQRVAAEKGQQQQAVVLETNIETIRQKAGSMHAQDQVQSNKLLHAAYTLLKESLTALRDGDTLTQSLDFANALEEYQYYENKIASQLTALDLLLSVYEGSSRHTLLNNMMSSSNSLVSQARELAQQSRHQEANKLMDKAFSRLQTGLMMSLSVQ